MEPTKIFWVLSIFLPALPFVLGLLIGYWMWYKGAGLNSAIGTNEKIRKDINGLGAGDFSGIKDKVSAKIQATEDAWSHKVASKDQELAEKGDLLLLKEDELAASKGKVSDLNLQLEEQNKKFIDLDSSFTRFKEEKDNEYNSLLSEKNALASGAGASGEAEEKLAALQSEYDRMELEKKSQSQTITNLIEKVDALEAEKAAGGGEGAGDAAPVNVAKLEPAAFFAGSQAVENDRYGFIYEGADKTDHVDDLTEIKGVGEVLAGELNNYGVYQFKQVALWDHENIDNFQTDLDFPGRVERDQWVNQAADLHRKHHGQHLAPVVDIYHPAPKPERKSKEAALAEYEGEDVTADDDLGVVFNSRPEEVDDLKLIKGVANVLEGRLHEIGIYRFKQICDWDTDHMAEFSNRLDFPGRIERDNWKDQAKQFYKEKYGQDYAG